MSSNELLAAVYERVGEMSAKLDTYHDETKELSVRVRRLEATWAKVTGMLALPYLGIALIVKRLTGNKSA